MPIIDAVIPTYHPQERFLALLQMLAKQKTPLRRIHVINTDQGVFDRFLAGQEMIEADFLARFPQVDLEHITPEEFDHGGTRNAGIRKCLAAAGQNELTAEDQPAQYALLMTQDALPKDEFLTRNLLSAFSQDRKIEAVYARQLANQDASTTERITREFNYPETPVIKSQADFSRLGIKTYFCSNVCAMYRLDVWQELGGFPTHMIFNEDMVYAGRALQAGWKIAYVPAACVYHSHNYTATQQFHRNFDLGVSQSDHPEIFAATHSEGEGTRYVKNVITSLKTRGATAEIPNFIWTSASRYLGYRLGKSYRHLPKSLIHAFTSNPAYWDHPGNPGNSQKMQ